MKTRNWIRLTLLAVLSTSNLHAQRGDKRNETQPEVWKDMDVPAAPVLAAADALKSFAVAPGFRIELVACEPMIVNPVEARFDENNRLWVVEMTSYMASVDGAGEDQLNGRVSILEDQDGDGRMDKSIVFLDKLLMPRALALVKGGALISEPPHLWYCRDTNNDGTCDEKTDVARYAKQGPVEHTENGLVPALDNWLYNAKSNRRFKFIDGRIMEEKTNSRGQWGIAQDNYGRLFYNSNSSYLHADTIPYHYLRRNPAFSPRWGIGGRVVTTSEIFSARVNPGINRGYQGGMLKSDGKLARVTAISGQAIYRGDQFPTDYVGDAFIPEPAANAVAHFSLEDKGIYLSASHHTYPHATQKKVEFLTSTDERFRPVNTMNGPDGCLYVVDLYHGILQHKVYVTSYLRKQIVERKLDQNNLNGRIYRIVHEGKKPELAKASLDHANGWARDTAQRVAIQQDDATRVPAIKQLVKSNDHLAQIHALWTLEGMAQLDAATISTGLQAAHPQTRIAALRAGEHLIAQAPDLVELLKTEKDPMVALQLMFTLGESDNLPAMKNLLARFPGDKTLREAAVTGLKGREAALMQLCVSDHDWKDQDTVKLLASVIDASSKKTKSAPLAPLNTADQKLFAAGKNDFLINCSACHLPNGEGQPAVAPTLVNTPWVNGSPERLIRIVLGGLMGPIEVDEEEWDLVMPPHRDHPLLDDTKIAGVLTYARRSWGNNAPPIQPADVKRIREETNDRIMPWTVKELLQVK